MTALRGVVGNRALRRAQLSFLVFSVAEAGTWVAILVYAYDRGGTAATGLVGLMLTLPAGIVAPMAAALGDRYRRERLLFVGYLTQAVATGATAVAMLLDAPPGVVYGLALVAIVALTTSRPGHHSLVPTLARTPDEVTAGNSVSSLGEGLGGTIGTASVTLILAVAGPGVAYAAMALMLAAAGALMVGVRSARPPVDHARLRPWTLAVDALVGLAAVARAPSLRLLVAMAALVTLTWGAFDILLVTIGIESLGIGDSGVGVLQTAVGVGALAGAAVSVALVGRRVLVPALIGSSLVLGLGILGSGAAVLIVVIGAVGAAGVGLALLDVIGRTLLQRVVDDAILTRVFGAIEALWMAGVGFGAALAAGLVGSIGLGATLAVFGIALPAFTLVTLRGLRRVDALAVVPERQIALLSAIPMFAVLPRTDLERVARQLDRIETPAGTAVIRQGDLGDRFYVIDAGSFTVEADGRSIAELHEGGYFGEIALLYDEPRNATVRAISDGAVWALDQEEFLATITGLPQAETAAHQISAERLRTRRP